MLIALVVCLLIQGHWVLGTDEKTLFAHLFDAGHYNNHVRPVLDSKRRVNVTLDFELNQISNLDEKNQELSVVGFVLAEWTDEHLTWDPVQYGDIIRLVVPPSLLWLPDFGVLNSVDTFYHDEFTQDFRVILHSDGHVTWSFGGNFKTSCNLDNTYYPFDLQKCGIEMENWAYTVDQVDLITGHHEILLDHYTQHGIWEIDHTDVKRNLVVYDTHPDDGFPEVIFTIYMRRKVRYYLLNIIAPCGFILMVALGVFWLPADSGEKLGFGVTVLLAFSVFQLVINEQTPQNSDYNPLLGVLVLSIMGLSSVSVLCCILVLYLHHKGASARPPRSVRVIFLKHLSRAMCMGSEVTPYEDEKVGPAGNSAPHSTKSPIVGAISVESFGDAENDLGKVKAALKDKGGVAGEQTEILDILRYMEQRMRGKDADERNMDEWRSVAKVVDRMLFWLTLSVAVIIISSIFSQRDTKH